MPEKKLATVWGRVQKPLLILPSEKDQFRSRGVDLKTQVAKWKGFCKPGIASNLSAPIPGANHEVSQPKSREWLGDTVVQFLTELEGASM